MIGFLIINNLTILSSEFMSIKYGLISLVVNIVGLIFGWIPLLGFFAYIVVYLFPVVAIVIGGIGITKDDSKAIAVVGLIIGIVTIVIMIILGPMIQTIIHYLIFGSM